MMGCGTSSSHNIHPASVSVHTDGVWVWRDNEDKLRITAPTAELVLGVALNDVSCVPRTLDLQQIKSPSGAGKENAAQPYKTICVIGKVATCWLLLNIVWPGALQFGSDSFVFMAQRAELVGHLRGNAIEQIITVTAHSLKSVPEQWALQTAQRCAKFMSSSGFYICRDNPAVPTAACCACFNG